MLKKLVCITLFISVIMFPTSTFASKDNSSVNSQKNNSNQTIDKFLSSFSNNKNEKDDFWDKNKHEAKDWYDKNKDFEPTEESYDIWKKWYCD